MNYCPDTEQEIQEMLSAIGINSIANLFDSVPEDMMTKSFDLPAGLSEIEVFEKLKKLSRKNCYAQDCICFLVAVYMITLYRLPLMRCQAGPNSTPRILLISPNVPREHCRPFLSTRRQSAG